MFARSRSWRLREFSNSAFRRRRASRYWSRSQRVASSSSESAINPSASGSVSTACSSSIPSGAPGSPASLSRGAGGSEGRWVSSSGPTSSVSSGSRLFSSLLKAAQSSYSCRAGGRGGTSLPHPGLPAVTLWLLALLGVLVLVDDLGIFHQVVGVRGPVGARLLLLLCLAVEYLGELVGGRHQRLLLALYLLDVAACERLLCLLYGLFDLQLGVRVYLAVDVLERALDRVDQVVRVVADVRLLAAALVILSVRLRILHHLLDLRVRKPARGRDRDPLLLAGTKVLGPDVDYAVGVYVEGDFDLGHAPRRRRDANQLEVADDLVVGRYLSFALVDLDLHRPLVVISGCKHLALTCGYGGVPFDELGEHTTLGLYTKGERRNVE